jgi:hypothetical protein
VTLGSNTHGGGNTNPTNSMDNQVGEPYGPKSTYESMQVRFFSCGFIYLPFHFHANLYLVFDEGRPERVDENAQVSFQQQAAKRRYVVCVTYGNIS